MNGQNNNNQQGHNDVQINNALAQFINALLEDNDGHFQYDYNYYAFQINKLLTRDAEFINSYIIILNNWAHDGRLPTENELDNFINEANTYENSHARFIQLMWFRVHH